MRASRVSEREWFLGPPPPAPISLKNEAVVGRSSRKPNCCCEHLCQQLAVQCPLCPVSLPENNQKTSRIAATIAKGSDTFE
nr:unnamed protein product [Haemonchus contortus]